MIILDKAYKHTERPRRTVPFSTQKFCIRAKLLYWKARVYLIRGNRVDCGVMKKRRVKSKLEEEVINNENPNQTKYLELPLGLLKHECKEDRVNQTNYISFPKPNINMDKMLQVYCSTCAKID